MKSVIIYDFESKHLPKNEQIKLGSFYTPEKIVNTVHSLIEKYKAHSNVVIFDNSAGAGAFIKQNDGITYKAVECDPIAGKHLKKKLPEKNLFIENSILNVNRKKYNISNSDFLIQVGNPPYNDITSSYRNGQKGKNICDPDLFDRDLGISFLKSYDKLQSNVVCVLHPLSYLIKPVNFKRLKTFAKNYTLKKGILFSSELFNNVSNTYFPIVIALYEKNRNGMRYEDIRNFVFSILDSKKTFKLSDYFTVDSFIRKYPPKKTDDQNSNIGLYYYTFRDINSLMRNRGFHFQRCVNSIVVNMENLYKYTYLLSFKKLFRPKDLWLYGNLSPLGSEGMVKKYKNYFVQYALISEHKVFSKLEKNIMNKILRTHSITKQDLKKQKQIENFVLQLIDRCCAVVPPSSPTQLSMLNVGKSEGNLLDT